MSSKLTLGLAALLSTALTVQSDAQIFQIGQPGDPPANNPNGNFFPGGESPPFAIDGVNGTKYLNFGELNTGFIVTPTGGAATTATGIEFVTGGDAAERDPASYSLYGSNTIVLTSAPAAGTTFNLSSFTIISSGALTLPGNPLTDDQRGVTSAINFTNTTPFITYLLVFPTVKDSGSANSMQIAEAVITGAGGDLTPAGSPIGGGQLIPEPASAGMLALGAMLLLRRRRN